MEYVDAVATLRMLVRQSEEPTLSDDELDRLLTMARRADAGGNPPSNDGTVSAYVAGSEYLAGTVVLDSTYARYWLCLTSGTSVSNVFPDLSGVPRADHTVRDGGVLWVDNGTRWTPTYDLHAAAVMGWQIKAAQVSGNFDFITENQTFNRRQVFANCLEMAAAFTRKGPRTMVVTGR